MMTSNTLSVNHIPLLRTGEYYHKNPGKGAIRNTPLID